jgi:predicted RNA binding protein YcfA (HicA-like mRNA interferase family)
LIAALEKLGFERVRQKGSHVVLRRGSQGAIVPLHRQLKTGTLAGVLRQAGISADDLLDVLK